MAVEFEEQQFNQPRRDDRGAVSNIIFKLGLAKTPAQANIVLLVIAIVAVGLAVYLLL